MRPPTFAAFCAASSVTPASTIIVPPAASTSRTALRRAERQHDLVAFGRWDLAADKPRIAALRNDRDVFGMGERENARNFLRRARTQNDRRLARVAVPPFGEICGLILGARQRVRVADDVCEAPNQIVG